MADINGYTGTEITNQALMGIIQSAGGETRPVLSAACTHIVTAMPLSAKKAQHELERKRAGPRIVLPQWVIDSVRLGMRQPEWKYSVQHSQVCVPPPPTSIFFLPSSVSDFLPLFRVSRSANVDSGTDIIDLREGPHQGQFSTWVACIK